MQSPRPISEKARRLVESQIELRESGRLFWREPGPGRRPTLEAGGTNGKGYKAIRIGGETLSAHHVVWLLANGHWPTSQIDHIDGNKANNCPSNLRMADCSQNAANRKTPCTNTSGQKGVSWKRDKHKWRASISARGKQIHLGYFNSSDEARAAYDAAAIRLFGRFARVNSPAALRADAVHVGSGMDAPAGSFFGRAMHAPFFARRQR